MNFRISKGGLGVRLEKGGGAVRWPQKWDPSRGPQKTSNLSQPLPARWARVPFPHGASYCPLHYGDPEHSTEVPNTPHPAETRDWTMLHWTIHRPDLHWRVLLVPPWLTHTLLATGLVRVFDSDSYALPEFSSQMVWLAEELTDMAFLKMQPQRGWSPAQREVRSGTPGSGLFPVLYPHQGFEEISVIFRMDIGNKWLEIPENNIFFCF